MLFAACNGYLLSIDLVEVTNNVCLKCRCYRFNQGYHYSASDKSKAWIQHAKGALPIFSANPRNRTRLVKVSDSISFETGQRHMIVIAENVKQSDSHVKRHKVTYIVSSIGVHTPFFAAASDKCSLTMNLHYYFTLDCVIADDEILTVSDRYLLYVNKGGNCLTTVKVCSGQRASVEIIAMFPDFVSPETATCVISNESCVIFVTCYDKTLNKKRLSTYRLTIDDSFRFRTAPIGVDDGLIPEVFLPSLRTVHVRTLTLTEPITESVVYITTNDNRLLKFSNGSLTQECEIEESTNDHKLMVYEGRFHDFVIISSETGIRVYSEHRGFQCVFEKLDSQCVLLDDFLGHGGKQLLFMMDTPVTIPPCSWLLTDLSGCHYDTSTGSLTASLIQDTHDTSSVMEALQRRLNEEYSVIQEKERVLTENHCLINDLVTGLSSMTDSSMQSPIQIDTSGLVAFCGQTRVSNRGYTHQQHRVLVKKLFDYHQHSMVIIGATFTNKSTSIWRNLALFATPRSASAFITQTNSVPGGSPSLSPDDTATLLCTLKDYFMTQQEDFDVFLSHCEADSCSYQKRNQSGKPLTVYLGCLTIDPRKHNQECDSSLQEIIDAVVYTQTKVTVTVPSHLLLDIPTVLSAMGFTLDNKACSYVGPSTDPSLMHCKINLDLRHADRMTLITRNKEEFYWLVKALYRHLPDSAVMTSLNRSYDSDHFTSQAAIDALTQELSQKIEFFQVILTGDKNINSALSRGEGTEGSEGPTKEILLSYDQFRAIESVTDDAISNLSYT